MASLALAGSMMTGVQAQTEKGSKLLGLSAANLSYSRASKGNNSFVADLLPSGGVFVANNLAVGAGLILRYERRENTSNQFNVASHDVSRSISYGLAPFARYYFLGTQRHRLFGQVAARYTLLNNSLRYSYNDFPEIERTFKTDYLALEGGVGYNYFIAPNVALEALLG